VARVARRRLDFERLFKCLAGGAKISLDHPRLPEETPPLDDARVIHESTPIQPSVEGVGWRDTLVLTFRSEGFQDPPKTA
jgi:hypothetical protein